MPDPHGRVLSAMGHHEDAFVISAPPAGMALVQSVDILSPIGNNPRLFGQCAAANALSDIYAMGGEAYSAMNILSFCAQDIPIEVVQEILLGAAEKIAEANAVHAGGHTLEDSALKFGLSVTGMVNPSHFSRNNALEVGDGLILTKPIGTGVLSTGIKARWDNFEQAEKELYACTTHLNKNASSLIQSMKIFAATDITGFGLGGHALEMAQASQKSVRLFASEIPLLPYVRTYAENGLIPQGSYANYEYAQKCLVTRTSVDELLVRLIFDAQTSGGLLLAVPKNKISEATKRLQDLGEQAYLVGEVTKLSDASDIAESIHASDARNANLTNEVSVGNTEKLTKITGSTDLMSSMSPMGIVGSTGINVMKSSGRDNEFLMKNKFVIIE